MKKFFLRAVLFLVLLVVVAYAIDLLSLRLHIPPSRVQTSVVHVQPYIAVPRKDGKLEFMLDTPYDQTCANSLFPQLGYPPCWYTRKHRDVRTNI